MTFAAVLLLTGCGHNAIQYGDGIGFNVGINPNNYMLSLNLRYGKILSAVVRDNVELELFGKADANGMTGDQNTAGASSDGSLKLKIGRQINGGKFRWQSQAQNRPSDQRCHCRSGEDRSRFRKNHRKPEIASNTLKGNLIMTKKQKITAVLALAIAFGLGMAVMCGCSYFTQEKVAEIHKTVGTILDIAYTSGGAVSFQSKTWPSKFPSKNEARLGASFRPGFLFN